MLHDQALEEIFHSYRDMRGHWPREYTAFYSKWGYFNQVYDTLYSHDREWKRIAMFALNFPYLWPEIEEQAREIASLPCVGNGRGSNEPTQSVRIASNRLRLHFGIISSSFCNQQNWKCSQRQTRCSNMVFQLAPSSIDNTDPLHGVFTLLGATLTIVYQIRNNLFHGSKREFSGDEFKRNLQLVTLSDKVIEIILDRVSR